TRCRASPARRAGRTRRAAVPNPSKQTAGVLARTRHHEAARAASMAQITVGAGEGPARARKVFQEEGVVVLKGVLPAAFCDATHDFLSAALTAMAGLFARYGLALDAPDCGREVTRRLDSPANVPPAEDRHALLGHFPLPVRLDEALWQIPL